MRIKITAGAFLLLVALLSGSKVNAQGVTDSLLYRQAKLEIWCETMKFIYRDNQADSLLATLNCQDWMAYDKSLQPNYLYTGSFYRSIEKPSIYSGYTTYQAKLQKLVEEIAKKLKAAPTRAADQSRLQKVDSLQASLIALAAVPSVALAQESAAVAIEEEVEDDNEINTIAAVRQEAADENIPLEDDQMNWIEILQWLLLILLTAGLAFLWAQNSKLKKELEIRMKRRKEEISAITRIKESDKPEKVKPKTADEPKGLTQGQVVRLIRAEIEKVREEQRNRRQQQLAANEKQHPRQPKPMPTVEPTPPPPAAEVRKEIQAENTNTIKEEPVEEKIVAKDGLLYDKLPFKGGFHQHHLSQQRHPDSIYSIQVLRGKPDEAEFWVTEDQEVQKYAMQNGLSFFEEACEYSQVEENPSRVRNLEKGKLRKNGPLWQIEKKVKVSFE